MDFALPGRRQRGQCHSAGDLYLAHPLLPARHFKCSLLSFHFGWNCFLGLLLSALFGVGTASSVANTKLEPPVISDFIPASGPVDSWVTITGTNLDHILSIQFNGIEAEFTTMHGIILPTARVPKDATTGPITITTEAGSFTTAKPFTVTVVGLPVVTAFSPTSGKPGTVVHFSGTDLGGITGLAFNGTPALFADGGVNGNPAVIGIVPDGATSGPITYTTKAGSFTTTEIFTVPPPPDLPVIEAFVPDSGPPGTFISVSGANLVDVRSITLNGQKLNFWSNGLNNPWTAIIPLHATSGPITLITTAGTCVSTNIFTVTALPKPVITGFSPEAAAPGAEITIKGANFQYVRGVLFSGIGCWFMPWRDDSINAIVPYVKSGPVIVITEGGLAVSPEPFAVIGGPESGVLLPGFVPGPEITAVWPTNGPSGAQVAISGNYFNDVSMVLFNGVPAEFYSSLYEILATVPPGASPGDIIVLALRGSATAPQPFGAFNSGHLSVSGTTSVERLFWGKTATFSIAVTNMAAFRIEQLRMTNSFASNDQRNTQLVAWRDDCPVFDQLVPADLELVSVKTSAGTCRIEGGAVLCEGTSLSPGASLIVELTVRPRTSATLHLLSWTRAIGSDSQPVFASSLTSLRIAGPLQLVPRRLSADEMELTWPAGSEMLLLESCENLSAVPAWVSVAAIPSVADGVARVVLPLGTESRFYRLRPAAEMKDSAE